MSALPKRPLEPREAIFIEECAETEQRQTVLQALEKLRAGTLTEAEAFRLWCRYEAAQGLAKRVETNLRRSHKG